MPRDIGTITDTQLLNQTWRVTLVKLEVPGNTLRLTGHHHDLTTTDGTYLATSGLVQVGTVTDDIDAKDSPMVVTLSGVNRSFVATVLANDVKHSKLTLYRGFYDSATGTLIGEPYKRWVGRADQPSITDGRNIVDNDRDEITIGIVGRHLTSLLQEKQSGIYTSETSWKRHYPGDRSMDNVAGLEDTEFNFGKED